MERRKLYIDIVYGLALFYLIFKFFYYYEEVDWGPDERAHLSYIYYEYCNPNKIVPEFENMPMVDFDIVGDKAYITGMSEEVCYLMHPPLYYKLVSWLGCVKQADGTLYIDMYKVLLINISFVVLGIMLCMEMGRRKLEAAGNQLICHILFATVIVSLPMVSYVGAGASNDNILYLAVGLMLIGLERGVRGNRGYATYWLIGLGVLIAVMSKLTLGMISLILLGTVVLYIVLQEKNVRVIFCRQFASTLPLYLFILSYFLILKSTYSAFQPEFKAVSPESWAVSEFAACNDLGMTLAEAIRFFWSHFWNTWSTIYSHTVILDKSGTLGEVVYGMICFGALVFGIYSIYFLIKKRCLRDEIVLDAFVVGNLVVFLYQMISMSKGYASGGRLGGYQARYYICCIAIFALCDALLFQILLNCLKKHPILKKCAYIAGGLCIVCCLYNDFFYFITHFTWYRMYA